MTQQNLDETTAATIFLFKAAVLHSELVGLLCLHGNLAFQLRDVFCRIISVAPSL